LPGSVRSGISEYGSRNARFAFLIAPTHGDNDVSNLIVTPEGICLLDWETARWASPAVDLGNVLAWLPTEHTDMALTAYLRGVERGGGEAPSKTDLDTLIAHGRFYDGMKLIGSYLNRDNREAPRDWFESYVAPRVALVNELSKAGAV